MNQDQNNLDLLAIFHYVVGGITALFSCFPFIHLAVGLAVLFGGLEAEEFPALVAWMFILIPAVIIIAGWTLSVLIIIAGRKLKRREAYTYCLVIAAVECLFMPLGTVLGVFTIIMLMKEPVKELFSPPAGN